MECINTQQTHFDLALPTPIDNASQRSSAALGELLQGGTVGLHYQPQFFLADGKVRGLEALLRVRNDQDEMLNPAQIVSQAERRGLIHELGEQILATACADYSAMRKLGCEVGRLSVNVSPLQFNRHDFVERALRVIENHGISFADVELEIIESWSLHDPNLHLEQLQTFADVGIGLAMDDFGTGHANWLNALKLPFSTLKIDRSLIADIETREDNLAVINSICQACTEMDMDVVAEGVSNAAQLELLVEARCQSGQGFGLGMPMAPDEAMDVTPLSAVALLDQPVIAKAS